MSFNEKYSKRKEEFDGYLNQFANELAFTLPPELAEAVSYSLLSGGKRLRPVLLLECVRMFGGKIDATAVNFALAVECIHTYSLIHDDLPCMDNDDFRRGKPTCHKKFGEAVAMLAGDALLNTAYELMLSAIAIDSRHSLVKASTAIATAAGGKGMVGGQVYDISENISDDLIDAIYLKKTAALIAAATKAGAYIGGASEENAEKIHEYGTLFGYGFQLRDDILDGDKDKNSYLKIHGAEQTGLALKNKTVDAVKILQTFDNSDFLTELTVNFMERAE